MVRVPLWPTVPHHYSLKVILLQHKHGHGLNLLACVYTEADVRVTSIIFYNVKSKRMRWPGHITRMGETRNAYRKSRKERDHYEDQDVGGWAILK
jgi:hypothetical protein